MKRTVRGLFVAAMLALLLGACNGLLAAERDMNSGALAVATPAPAEAVALDVGQLSDPNELFSYRQNTVVTWRPVGGVDVTWALIVEYASDPERQLAPLWHVQATRFLGQAAVEATTVEFWVREEQAWMLSEGGWQPISAAPTASLRSVGWFEGLVLLEEGELLQEMGSLDARALLRSDLPGMFVAEEDLNGSLSQHYRYVFPLVGAGEPAAGLVGGQLDIWVVPQLEVVVSTLVQGTAMDTQGRTGDLFIDSNLGQINQPLQLALPAEIQAALTGEPAATPMLP